MLYLRFRFEKSDYPNIPHKNRSAPAAHFPVIYENRIFMVHEFGNIRSVVLSVRIASMFVRCVATIATLSRNISITYHLAKLYWIPVENHLPLKKKKKNVTTFFLYFRLSRFIRWIANHAISFCSGHQFFFLVLFDTGSEGNIGEEAIARKCKTRFERALYVSLDNRITRKYFSERFTRHLNARLTFDRSLAGFDYMFDNGFGAWWKR